MRIINVTKNDKGQNENLVKLSFDEVQYLKQAVNLVIQAKLGDSDDSEQIRLGGSLADDLLECKNQLRPN